MSAFCQGFMSLSEIERHTFSALKSLSAFLNRMAVVCRYFMWALSLLFVPCRLSEFTMAGPLSPLEVTNHEVSMIISEYVLKKLRVWCNRLLVLRGHVNNTFFKQ